ncbi:MAG: GreA/GreB family elongation factor [Lentisphaerae bacterium]|nr:GreA/GreB family elongation factor [Lentisphaerota bacterium]
MENNQSWRELADDKVEELFLGRLSDSKRCFPELMEIIVWFAGKQLLDLAEACAELLQDALKKEAAETELLLLLERRALWQFDPRVYASVCVKILADFFPERSLKQMYLAACGLQDDVLPREALRRLKVLCDLTAGKCCYEKTWGLGAVAEIDQFDRKFVINFEGKPAHRLAFGYAGEAVQPLADDNFLALKLREPEKFKAWIKANPAEAVKETIRQFGEMNLTRLRALMTGLMFAEKDWSEFWSSARAKLSADPLVAAPGNRNDPIRLLAVKKTFDEHWRGEFAALNDAEKILSEIEQLLQHYSPQKLPEDFKKAVEDRLKFVLYGLGAPRHAIIVPALLLADEAQLAAEGLFAVSAYGQPDLLASALNALPARLVGPFLAYLEKKSALGAETIPQMMAQLSAVALNEAVAYCRRNGGEEKLFNLMRTLLRERAVGIEMFAWMARNLQLVCERQVCRPDILAETALDLLKTALAVGKRKHVGQLLRLCFTNKVLLKEMLPAMSAEQRLDFSRRLALLSGLTAADKQSIAAKIILLFPDLAGAFSDPAVAVAAPKLTSWRSYRERQERFDKLIKEDIPRNSKEIGVARSYGDLRENYEYKAAREMQAVLMRRKAEYEKMLSEVKGTDFAGIKPEVAGPGASVELKLADGSGKTYHILGEWDSDEKLGIISYRSKLAEVLNGRRRGDAVELPSETSPVSCVVESVSELPPEIKAWINA